MVVKVMQHLYKTQDGQENLLRVTGGTVSLLPCSIEPKYIPELIDALDDALELLDQRGVIQREGAHNG